MKFREVGLLKAALLSTSLGSQMVIPHIETRASGLFHHKQGRSDIASAVGGHLPTARRTRNSRTFLDCLCIERGRDMAGEVYSNRNAYVPLV